MTDELDQARADLKAHRSTMIWAYAFAHGCTWGSDPRLDYIRVEDHRLVERIRELEREET